MGGAARSGLASAFAPNHYVFMALRVLSGVLSVGLTSVSWVYCTELATVRMRALVPLLMNLLW